MSPRALVYAAMAAVLLAVPGAATAVTVSATLAPKNSDGTVYSGANLGATCSAVLSSGMLGNEAFSSGTATVSGGTFVGGATSVALTAEVATAAGLSLPVIAAATGTLRVDCTVNATLYGSPRTGTAFAEAAIVPSTVVNPDLKAFSVPSGTVLVNTSYDVSALAEDPAGGTVTYAWSATAGTFADATAASTTWTAPTTGTFTITVTASNAAGGSATRTSTVTVALSLFQSTLPTTMHLPMRVAATPSGDLFVVNNEGKLFMLTRVGGLRVAVALGSKARAVAASADTIFVATEGIGIVKIDPGTSRIVGRVTVPFYGAINGLAFDGARGRLWAATAGGTVYALAPDGSLAATLSGLPTRAFSTPSVDVAYDAGNDVVWVAENRTEQNPDFTVGQMLHAFRGSDLTYLRSTATYGSQVTSVNGVAVGTGGKLYVSDSYSGAVQAYAADGSAIGNIGTIGEGQGSLLLPAGLAFMANGDLAVANSHLDRIDRFGTGAPLPTCAGDSDCDGLPDAWELAHGLNPNDPSDSLTDLDGDGLNNREEFALGTDPRKADTDGDGYSDRAEMLAGFNPNDPNDHRPQLTVGGPVEVPPGLVSISATASGPVACAAAWRQLSGAAVSLRNAATFTPSFVARKAGTYRFEGIATCGTATSAPAVAEVKVLNVAPIADAGSDVVTSPGRTVTLSGSFSSDANGDALTYTWRQVKPDPVTGPRVALSARGSSLTIRPSDAGYYAFELTARDAAGLEGKDTLGVVVVKDGLPTAIVAEPLVTATVGLPVTLNASESLPQGAAFAWRQAGSDEVLGTAETLTFTPSVAGRYVIEVTVANGALVSPPARVVVLASTATLPTAVASAPVTGTVNGALTLDGTLSTGTSLSYRWRQVAGPAAGISDAFSAAPTVVPFATGAFAFELTVAEGDAVSAPATVRFDVVAPGKVLPVASATAPAGALVGDLVMLDGGASTGGTNYRWTQVAGPWVALDSASAAEVFRAAVFRAPIAGTYRFELMVDDGTVRSAPYTVTVNVQ